MPEIVYKNPIDVITFKIFGIFDAFRQNSKFNNIEDSVQIVLLLVSLYKDEVINEESFTNDLDISKLKVLVVESKLNNQSKETYLHVIEVLSSSLAILFSQPLNYLSFHLFQLNKNELNKNFSKLFDHFLYKLSEALGKYTNEFIQPFELTRFIMNLAKVKHNSKIYNPFAGLASFATFLNKTNHYYGQEINQKTWVLGKLRLLAHNHQNFEYNQEDSIENWNKFGVFDLIVSNPPFNLKLFNKNHKRVNLSLESIIIENSLDQLSNEGKLICVFPESFLFKKIMGILNLKNTSLKII